MQVPRIQVQWNKDKDRPSKADLIRMIDQHFNGCQCEATTHTISERSGGCTYTITRSVDPIKVKTS